MPCCARQISFGCKKNTSYILNIHPENPRPGSLGSGSKPKSISSWIEVDTYPPCHLSYICLT